jgi:beta-glucanase (GH16 family)
MKIITVILFIFSFVLYIPVIYGQDLPNFKCQFGGYISSFKDECNYDSYILVFEDNFDGNELDVTKWRAEIGVPRDHNFDNMKAYYLPENIEVNNGTLKIIAKKLPVPTSMSYRYWSSPLYAYVTDTSVFEYTTGEFWSRYKFGYGKFEIRCKIPKGKGLGQAFWTYSGGPWNEIDIFEFQSEKTNENYNPDLLSRRHNMNIHTKNEYYKHECHNHYTDSDFSLEFHTFTLIWTPYKIEWYVDDDLKRTVIHYYNQPGQVMGCNSFTDSPVLVQDLQAFPVNPMNIVAGMIVQNGDFTPDSSTPFPSAYEIDYIRYYKQLSCDNSNNITDISDIDMSSTGYNIVVGTSGSFSDNFILQSSQQLDVVYSEEIAFKPGVEINSGGNFIARIDENICLNSEDINSDFDDNATSLLKNQELNEDLLNYGDALLYDEEYNNIKVYPNPANEKVNIELPSDLINNCSIYIMNIHGRKLYSQDVINDAKIEINITNYISGMYLLNIFDIKNQAIHSYKIIKEK